jgi:hypothetical protein
VRRSRIFIQSEAETAMKHARAATHDIQNLECKKRIIIPQRSDSLSPLGRDMVRPLKRPVKVVCTRYYSSLLAPIGVRYHQTHVHFSSTRASPIRFPTAERVWEYIVSVAIMP